MFVICGPARSGTSLLSSLLNSHPAIGCAQDTTLFNSMKFAYSQLVVDNMPDMQVVSNPKQETFRETWHRFPLVGFSRAPFKPEIIRQIIFSPLSDVLSSQSIAGKVLGQTLSNLSKCFFVDFQIDDPRKDRALGLNI